MKARGKDLDKGGARKGDIGARNQTAERIYRNEAGNGSRVGGPPANIRGL